MKLLPFEYAVRNLYRSPVRILLCVIGVSLVVMIILAAAAFVRGIERSLLESGTPENVILLGAGSEESVERSEISASVSGQAAASIQGIRSILNNDFVSPEVHAALVIGLGPDEIANAQVVFRGVTPRALLVHPQFRMVEGRMFNPGANEIIVGSLTATRLGLPIERLLPGNSIWIDGREWEIVGRFEAPNTVMDAEIWCSLADLQIVTKRDSLSCVVITMGSGEFSDVETFALSRLDLELIAVRETDYYQKLNSFYRPVRIMIWVTAGLIALGGIFGGLNTMYAAFVSRIREIGMLRSLGYTELSIIISFIQESLLAAGIGVVTGASAILLILEGVAVRFSMGAFPLVVDGPTMAIGIIVGAIIGLFGAIPPTIYCLKTPINEALKAI